MLYAVSGSFLVSCLPHADVGLVHRWLYEVVGILHRDLSPNNIMYRRIEGKVYGVLMDFDLSSWTRSLAGNYTKTSQQRTGTPPYMAHGVLDGTDPMHMYRHDVESIFYIILMLATRYEVYSLDDGVGGGLRARRELGQLPFHQWFNQSEYTTLSSSKHSFFGKPSMKLDLSPAFKDFGNWIQGLRRAFHAGFHSRESYKMAVSDEVPKMKLRSAPKTPEFDDETLGGHVTYSAFINPARELGLAVRYVPS